MLTLHFRSLKTLSLTLTMIEIYNIDTGYHHRACNKIHKFLDSPFIINQILETNLIHHIFHIYLVRVKMNQERKYGVTVAVDNPRGGITTD